MARLFLPYRRVDLRRLEQAPTASPTGAGPAALDRRVRWSIIALAVLLSGAQAVLNVLSENLRSVQLTGTLIPVMAFAVVLLIVVGVNPLLRRLPACRVRALNRDELVCLFAAMMVSSGVSSMGLSSQLVPLIGSPWNPEWNTPQRGWSNLLLPRLNPALYLSVPPDASPEQRAQTLEAIRQFREGLYPRDRQGRVVPQPQALAPAREQAAYMWLVLRQIQWWMWIKPIACWLVYVAACYGMFYCLTYMLLRHWSRQEKVIFPLAQLSMSLLPDDHAGGRVPAICRSGWFWAAFALSFALTSWNGAADAQMLGGLERINLGLGAQQVQALLAGGMFEGLTGGAFRLRFLIIFTAIGIAFLLPLEISFSTWSYFWLGKIMILAAVWIGYGQTGVDFPSDIYRQNNFVTAQAGGALLLFSVICLARSLLYTGQRLRGQARGRQLITLIPVAGLLCSMTIIVAWLRWNQLPLVWGILLAVLMVLFTVGLMRIVAEGGIYWIHAHVGPFHLLSTFGLGRFIPAGLIGPILPIYALLFMDTKTFLPPNLLNAAKMQDDQGTSRSRFHLSLLLSILFSAAVALGLVVFLAHLYGAQQMRPWFYSTHPQQTLDSSYRLMLSAEIEVSANAAWYVAGAAWLALSLVLRRHLLWFPNPIGYIMLVNPLIASLWFSFFIGWVCKWLVVRYGAKVTYDRVRPLFIGLIVGELLAILLWIVLSMYVTEITSPPTLNRFAR